MTQPIEIRSQTVWLDADGIVHAELRPRATLMLEDAIEAVAAIGGVTGGVARPILVDIREIDGITREARQYFAGPETAKVESAAALLIRSPLTRAIGNFFMGFNKPLFPTRLFTSAEDALQWLKTRA